MKKEWVEKYLGLAIHYSAFSKDPSAKVGCVLVDPQTNRSLGWGCNGLAAGHSMDEKILTNRKLKNERVIHAEQNSIFNAVGSVRGCVAFVTHPPCVKCCNILAQNGIKEVHYIEPNENFKSRWNLEDTKIEINALNMVGISHKFQNSVFDECVKLENKLKGLN